MATMIITLTPEPEGGSVIRIGLRSCDDTLPLEHELHHRSLATRLLPSIAQWQRERPAREAAVG